ncbi:hypothetical protein L1987_60850 [Smallanthus sonchifolius]|uniref:Uncharacterized protein n=1 Tax=Smallanthus sonchifolius TaxID=185202 RepID=A0ACB9D9C2_9ASTR|nr:hypothetical protein L1987_60850 [Smallanthus sonchifolius]
MTDPQNSDYVVETGVARNFEPWRAEDEVGVEEKRKRDAEEMRDGEENRTLDLKREMDILSAFDEMKSMKREEKLEEEDEALIKSIFQGSREFVRVIDDDELDDDDDDDDNITKRKVFQEVYDKPTDYLTKTTIADKSNKKDAY